MKRTFLTAAAVVTLLPAALSAQSFGSRGARPQMRVATVTSVHTRVDTRVLPPTTQPVAQERSCGPLEQLAAALLMITLGGFVGAAPIVVEHPAVLPVPTGRPVQVRNLDRSDDCPGTAGDRPGG